MPRTLALVLALASLPAAAIEGGTADHGDPAVGMLWLARDGAAREVPGLCTGTLIAPDVVLTAAHCVQGFKVLAFFTGLGASGTLARLVEPGKGQHAVAATAVFPGFRQGLCPNPSGDFALVKLAVPVAHARPLTLAAGPPKKGTVCTAVGFGAHARPDGTVAYEEKRRAQEAVNAANDQFVEASWKNGIVDGGDSGGPLLCGGGVAGVVSCHQDAAANHKTEFYASTSAAKRWIQDTLQKWPGAGK